MVPLPQNFDYFFGGQIARDVLGKMEGFWNICPLRAQSIYSILLHDVGFIWICNNLHWLHVVIADHPSRMGTLEA